jgi:hypothetical protein
MVRQSTRTYDAWVVGNRFSPIFSYPAMVATWFSYMIRRSYFPPGSAFRLHPMVGDDQHRVLCTPPSPQTQSHGIPRRYLSSVGARSCDAQIPLPCTPIPHFITHLLPKMRTVEVEDRNGLDGKRPDRSNNISQHRAPPKEQTGSLISLTPLTRVHLSGAAPGCMRNHLTS